MYRVILFFLIAPSVVTASDGPPAWSIPLLPIIVPAMSLNQSHVARIMRKVKLEKQAEEPLLQDGRIYAVQIDYKMTLASGMPAGWQVAPGCQIPFTSGTSSQFECRLVSFTNDQGIPQDRYNGNERIPVGFYRVSYWIWPRGVSYKLSIPDCVDLSGLAASRGVKWEQGQTYSREVELMELAKRETTAKSNKIEFTYQLRQKPWWVKLPIMALDTELNSVEMLRAAKLDSLPICKLNGQ